MPSTIPPPQNLMHAEHCRESINFQLSDVTSVHLLVWDNCYILLAITDFTLMLAKSGAHIAIHISEPNKYTRGLSMFAPKTTDLASWA